jgi:cellobiose-specific phosphotransferase system component IIA
VDHGGHPDKSKDSANMKKYVDSMMQDLRKAHKVREEQLSSAAQNYKTRLDSVLRKHEELLVAYRYWIQSFIPFSAFRKELIIAES